MIGRNSISPKFVKETIGEYNIYEYYLPNIQLDSPILSPFRDENNPSFRLSLFEKGLRHIDFGNTQFKGDCIELVRQLNTSLQLSREQAAALIYNDYKNGKISKEIVDVSSISTPREQRLSNIIIEPGKFTQEELDWWGSFGIEGEELFKDTFSPKEIWWNDKKIPTLRWKYSMCFAYEYWKNGIPFYKCYRPTAPKKDKWFINNVTDDIIDGSLGDAEGIIVTKSRKDYKVLKQVVKNVIGIQNEKIECMSNKLVKELKEKYKKVYTFYDNDKTGLETGEYFKELYGFIPLHTPNDLLEFNINDPAAWRQKDGNMKNIKKYLKNNLN